MKITIKVATQIEQLEIIVKKLSALSAHRPDLDITVDFTLNDKTEVNIDGTLKLDSPNLYKCVQECMDKVKKLGIGNPKEAIENAMRETLLKSGITKEIIVDDGENFLSPEKDIKTRFVEKELFFLLQTANSKIADTAYCTKDGEEWVLVTMENGSEYHIDITADSLLAAATDVCRFMMNR